MMEDGSLSIIRDSIVQYGTSRSNWRDTCPYCSHERKKSKEKTLSITIKDNIGLFFCHHCEESGSIDYMSTSGMPIVPLETQSTVPNSISYSMKVGKKQRDYLDSRKINGTSEGKHIVSGKKYFFDKNGGGSNQEAIGFRYVNLDGSEAVKWRCLDFKGFTQDGAARSLWGIENFKSGNIIITEGEIDCLSFREAGFTEDNGWTVVSVPNGAPSSVSTNDNSRKYSYLWDAKDALAKADKIIIASDNDKPGDSLAEEITRRIGRHKCWRLKYPEGTKDANEVLVKYGKDVVKDMLDSAIPWPIQGLRSVLEYEGHVLKYHNEGPVIGTGTGVKPVDELFNACPGSFVVVTGIPGSGKSTWLSWLLIKLGSRDDQKFAVWSAEMPPTMLVSNLCATYKEKAFRGSNGMSPEEVKESIGWIDDHVVIIETNDTDIDTICEGAIASILRKGITGLVVDPYNMITRSGGHSEEASLTNIRYILKKLKSLALEYSITVYLIAHPRKMLQEVGRPCVPTGYDVSGSADFYNIADIGITISRVEDGQSLMTNWKSRFPHFGKTGSNIIDFDLATGSYSDPLSGHQGSLGSGDGWTPLEDKVDEYF
mgnify:FL=1|tara:strand:+ start:538 stop:2331 length:1794 start_codon:yes stop_codon:yes gene_type:complete